MKNSIAALTALVLGACTPMTPAASSTSVLPPERTWVIVARPAQPAALDVVRMFQARGMALVDMIPDERGVLLRFKGERKTVAEQIVTGVDVAIFAADVAVALSEAQHDVDDAKDHKHRRHHHHHEPNHYEPNIEVYELGSVYYVRVEPRGETMTSIEAMGRPTRNGVEACTGDPKIIAPCAPLETGPDVHDEVAGRVEAELITGVFAELRLSGAVIAPNVEVAEASRRCWERRREVERAASRVSNSKAKANILGTAPNCEIAVEPPPAQPLAKTN